MIDGFMGEIELGSKIDTEIKGEEKEIVEMKEFPAIWKSISESIKKEHKTKQREQHLTQQLCILV